ncbi:hypothetical protein PPEP_a2437 [Pseudoalteromonas peptidolytica F12-50-A1]|uniref:Uncharacterized protein n=1 Tax=Pseudoalteromonas peptidolytica F12-50-A1 TaxID=1315280 RepID=A0A8I0T359_9GAMM|nr:hypothetical protein [Pseudoalteromonas peptidolytica F12-50-A1]
MPAQIIDGIVLLLSYHVFAILLVTSENTTWICAYLSKVELKKWRAQSARHGWDQFG